eukprot:scaffold5364_cov164-Amphora_coffeaeformis.AAC.19
MYGYPCPSTVNSTEVLKWIVLTLLHVESQTLGVLCMYSSSAGYHIKHLQQLEDIPWEFCNYDTGVMRSNYLRILHVDYHSSFGIVAGNTRSFVVGNTLLMSSGTGVRSHDQKNEVGAIQDLY